jgi:hypothetical protein
MSKEDHPAFRYKDASNQHNLFNMLDEAQELVRLTEKEIEQLDIDLRFVLLMLANYE